MTLLLIPIFAIGLVALSAYSLGKSIGWNKAIDSDALNEMYDTAYTNGYGKGFDDGTVGLDGAVAAVKAWGEECRQD